MLELRSQNDIKLHVEEVRKRGNQIKIGDKENNLSDIDTFKNETLEEIKNTKYSFLEDMVYRMKQTYNEKIDILDFKYISSKK